MRRALPALLLALGACATLRGGIDTAARVWDVTDERFTRWPDVEADAIVTLRVEGRIAEADRRADLLRSAVVKWDALAAQATAALEASEAEDVFDAAKRGLALLKEWGVLRR